MSAENIVRIARFVKRDLFEIHRDGELIGLRLSESAANEDVEVYAKRMGAVSFEVVKT